MSGKPNSRVPVHPDGWKFKGAAGGYRVWHAGKSDYRVTAPGGFEVIAQRDSLGPAFSHACQKMTADKAITSFYQDRASGCHAAKAP